MDWRAFSDATDIKFPIGVLVNSSSQIDFKVKRVVQNVWAIASIKFCNSVISILFLDSSVSNKWLVSNCELLAILRTSFTVIVNWLSWSWTLVFISICLLLAFICCISMNLNLNHRHRVYPPQPSVWIQTYEMKLFSFFSATFCFSFWGGLPITKNVL